MYATSPMLTLFGHLRYVNGLLVVAHIVYGLPSGTLNEKAHGRLALSTLPDEQATVEDLASVLQDSAIREALIPGYHVTTGDSWLNDPNAPLEYPKGTFHLFYQHNPVGSDWAAPYWAHVVSNDLVHWKQLPHAIIPDTYYDIDGVFSGSATLLRNNTPAILYTGVSRFVELGYYYQVQAIAVPQNASDPNLVRWVKQPYALIPEAPPGGNVSQFRDPTTAWVQEDSQLGPQTYHMAVGAQQDCVGGAALYVSNDFLNWTYKGLLFSQLALGDGQCSARTDGQTACDQFSSCPMWECPDYFNITDDIQVMKYSDQVRNRVPFGQDWYVLSDVPLNYSNSNGAFSPTLGGQQYTPKLWDFGTVYASKTFQTQSGRRIWWGWAYETALGCFEMCGTGSAVTNAMGWQGLQTLPREVYYDKSSQALRMVPVREVISLRTQLVLNSTTALEPNAQAENLLAFEYNVLDSQNPSNRQIEAFIRFALHAPSSLIAQEHSRRHADTLPEMPFEVGVVLHIGEDEETIIRVVGNWTDTRAPGQTRERSQGSHRAHMGALITSAAVFVDTTNSGGGTPTGPPQGGPIPLPLEGAPAEELAIRIFVDHSVIETFVLEGRACVTTRIYPLTADTAWGLSVFAGEASAADAASLIWQLGSGWVSKQTASNITSHIVH